MAVYFPVQIPFSDLLRSVAVEEEVSRRGKELSELWRRWSSGQKGAGDTDAGLGQWGSERGIERKQLIQLKSSSTWSNLWSMSLITSFHSLFSFATEGSQKLGCNVQQMPCWGWPQGQAVSAGTLMAAYASQPGPPLCRLSLLGCRNGVWTPFQFAHPLSFLPLSVFFPPYF